MCYGYEIPSLQRAAIRILSQPCSLHWCRWNWSTFDSVHSKRRDRLEPDRFDDLVYVHFNLWLQAIVRSKDGKCKPINFDEIDVGAEWPTEADVACTFLDDSWLHTPPIEVRGIPSFSELSINSDDTFYFSNFLLAYLKNRYFWIIYGCTIHPLCEYFWILNCTDSSIHNFISDICL